MGGCKIGFWNVAGLGNKDVDFWEGLREWDIIFLIETWVEERGWERIRGRLPAGYSWEAQHAKKKNKKGRAMGGMVLGIRVGIETVGVRKEKGEGVMERV
ncbi:hypothetical protein RF55_24379, partial [Lasius niger]